MSDLKYYLALLQLPHFGPMKFKRALETYDDIKDVWSAGLPELLALGFNAAEATVSFTGFCLHPGSSKNRMINAANIAMEYHDLLPAEMRPEHTEKREGFFHLRFGQPRAPLVALGEDRPPFGGARQLGLGNPAGGGSAAPVGVYHADGNAQRLL